MDRTSRAGGHFSPKEMFFLSVDFFSLFCSILFLLILGEKHPKVRRRRPLMEACNIGGCDVEW